MSNNLKIKMIGPFGECFFTEVPIVCPCGGIIDKEFSHSLGIFPMSCRECKAIFVEVENAS
jgi:hypothetical protein